MNGRTWPGLAVAILGIAGLPAAAPEARAQQSDALTLSDITSAADRLCNIVRLEGTAQTTRSEHAVKAEVDGLLSKLGLDAGASANAAQSSSSYQGLTQTDLLPAFRDSTACKVHVLDVLVTRLPTLQTQSMNDGNVRRNLPGAEGAPAAPLALAPRAVPDDPQRADQAVYGRWTTAATGDCSQRYYLWTFKGQFMEFVDQSDQVDVERVIAVRPDGISTVTTQSTHRDGSGEVVGTRWDYTFEPSGRVSVMSSGGKRFALRRCGT